MAKVAKSEQATDRQVQYITDLAEKLGAEDGTIWLLTRLSAPLSGRAAQYITRRDASALVQELQSAEVLPS